MKRLFLLAAVLTAALIAAAQPNGERSQMKHRPSVRQEAQMRTDQMASVIPLTDRQWKKVFRFYKKDIQYRRNHFEFGEFGGPGPRPDGNFPAPPDGNFPGGGPGMGQGQRPNGGPGGPGGPGMRPGNPPSGAEFGNDFDFRELERFNARQDRKLRRIIGDENFRIWKSSRHH